MLRYIGLVVVIAAAAAGGYAMGGGDPVASLDETVAEIDISGGSSAHVGGYFDSVSINNTTLSLDITNANLSHQTARVTAPDGWSGNFSAISKRTATASRDAAFPTGNYTVQAIGPPTLNNDTNQKTTVYLEQ